MAMGQSKLDDLAEKSAQKNGGTSAHYIAANQALRDDLAVLISNKFDTLINEMKIIKTELTECRAKLNEAKDRELRLLEKVTALENTHKQIGLPNNPISCTDKKDFYLVGSSILREIRVDDISNGTVQCIRGGKINDIQTDVENIDFKPKNIITHVGGNDLDDNDVTVEEVASQYEVLLTSIKEKFPESKVIMSGLPPRFHSDTIRTKVKDFNENMKKWSEKNQIQFIDNEIPFEYRTGEIDQGSYVMTGTTPAVHLTRKGTVRLLENLKKSIPEIELSDRRHMDKPTYANIVSSGKQGNAPKYQRQPQIYNKQYNREEKQRGCYYCAETNHSAEQCRYGQKIRCLKCSKMGHKMKFCRYA